MQQIVTQVGLPTRHETLTSASPFVVCYHYRVGKSKKCVSESMGGAKPLLILASLLGGLESMFECPS
jgi:hypothetical protein